MRKLTVILIWLIGLAAAGSLAAEQLRVMTYNVRYPNPADGVDFWDNRKEISVAVIREKDPDIFGTQELFFRQGEYFVEQLPDYKWFGLSRRGNHEDEHMGIFYKPSRLELLDSGNYWLSETPDVPGSMSWDVSLPRMVSWGRFRVKGSQLEFYFLNTHFPHRRQDANARVHCAEVIASRLASLPRDVPLILAGDFNAAADSEVHQTLATTLQDAWLLAENRTGPEGTSHGFTGKPGASRIDWILLRGPWKVPMAESITFHRDGRYPSDHFPVLTVLEIDPPR
jgi:endonuclease/exonuclease/phosphatase family metal-dependent hydrolase